MNMQTFVMVHAKMQTQKVEDLIIHEIYLINQEKTVFNRTQFL